MYSKIGRCLRDFNRLSQELRQCQQFHRVHYSSISKARDPFGVAEELGLEEMLQGIYIKPPVPKKPKEMSQNSENGGTIATVRIENNVSQLSHTETSNEDLEKNYEHLRRIRVDQIRKEDATAEAVYTPRFGQIRYDKDNIVKHHGQFDDEFFSPEDTFTVSEKSFTRLAMKSKELRNPESKTGMTQVTKSIEESKQNRLSKIGIPVQNASSDVPVKVANTMKSALKEVRRDQEEQESKVKPQKVSTSSEARDVSDDDNNVARTAYQYLKLKRMSQAQKEQDAVIKLGGKEIIIDRDSLVVEPSRHVPAVYEKKNYSDLTRDEMWNILRKQICFHNEFLVALNKPMGLPMHTATTECRHTIIDFLEDFANHCQVKQIFPCHRLDKDTTGVLLLAKSEDAANAIKMKFAKRTILKQYFAIVKNCPGQREGTIKIPIGEGLVPRTKIYRAVLKPDLQEYNISTMQKDCREAVTKFRVLTSHEHCAFLEVFPETGLTHQIRVHLAHGLGCPILGDHKYSHRDKMAPQRLHSEVLKRLKVKQSKVRHLPLHLHCSKLEFTMPDGFMSKNWNEPVFVHARPPYFFLHTLRALALKNR